MLLLDVQDSNIYLSEVNSWALWSQACLYSIYIYSDGKKIALIPECHHLVFTCTKSRFFPRKLQ